MNWWSFSRNLPSSLGWSFVERFIIKCLCILSSLNLLIAPFIRMDSSVAPVLLLSLDKHESLLSLGSLVKIFSLLLSAPVGTLNTRIAPVSLLLVKLDISSLKGNFLHGFWIVDLSVLSVDKSIPFVNLNLGLLHFLGVLIIEGSVVVVWSLEFSSLDSHGSGNSGFVTQ